MIKLLVAISLTMSATLVLAQENVPTTVVPVHLLATVEPLEGKEVPAVNREDIMALKGHDRLRVTEWLPLQGDNSGLELFLLVDDAASSSFGTYMGELRRFIKSQRAATSIGVAYMRNGTVFIAQNLTTDHAAAAKALRLPLGFASAGGSPYLSLNDLIKRWPADSERHEVLMLTSGADRLGGSGPLNPYLDTAIENAQRAGIAVYSIYTRGIGGFWRRFGGINWGQTYLAQLSQDTGGEAYYFLSSAPPVSFEPYLQDLAERLAHQYLLTFLAKPGPKAEFQSVKLTTEVPNARIVSAGKVYVPARQ
jgi:hypothetical protein